MDSSTKKFCPFQQEEVRCSEWCGLYSPGVHGCALQSIPTVLRNLEMEVRNSLGELVNVQDELSTMSETLSTISERIPYPD